MKNKLTFLCIFVAITGLLFGMAQGFSNNSLSFSTALYHLNILQQEFYSSLLIYGSIFGVIIGGFLCHRFGRKKIILTTVLGFLLFNLIPATIDHKFLFMVCRFFIGAMAGLLTIVIPMYLGEISDKKNRGRYMVFYSLFSVTGISFIFISNAIIGHIFADLHYMFFVIVVTSIVILPVMFIIPESPRWYILKGMNKDAERVLKLIKSENEASIIMKETEEIIEREYKKSIIAILKEKYALKVVGLVIALMVLQQLSGINSIVFYSNTIFEKAGFSNPNTVTILTGIIYIVFNLVSARFIDIAGRKTLLNIGLSIMLISLLALSAGFYLHDSQSIGISSKLSHIVMLVSVLFYCSAFGLSIGPICGIISVECLPTGIRDIGFSAAILSSLIFSAIVVSGTLTVISFLGTGTLFAIFAVFCFLGILFIKFFVPETKNKSLACIMHKNW